MEYTIQKLARLSGVSTRTLRYYNQIGLLLPARIGSNGYRMYGKGEVDRLQQILFYREFGLALEEIRCILNASGFNGYHALEKHLSALLQQKEQLESLITTVNKSMSAMKGEISMMDKEKFEGFKKEWQENNEKRYGEEIREKYGNKTVDAFHQNVAGMSQDTYGQVEALSSSFNELIKKAVEQGDPEGAAAQKACKLHQQWICLLWPEGLYTKESHMGLVDMYCEDERFKSYYEAIAPGCAEFCKKAIHIYYKA